MIEGLNSGYFWLKSLNYLNPKMVRFCMKTSTSVKTINPIFYSDRKRTWSQSDFGAF